MVMTLVKDGAENKAIEVMEKEMDSKLSLDLVNNPNAYAILYNLTLLR